MKRILRPVEWVVGPTQGTETVMASSVLFPGGIAQEFQALNTPNPPTGDTRIEMFDITEHNITFAEMMRYFGRRKGFNLSEMFWQQSQVVRFVVQHPGLMNPSGEATFLPMRVMGEGGVTLYKVASVYHHTSDGDPGDQSGQAIRLYPFQGSPSRGSKGRRLIVPLV